MVDGELVEREGGGGGVAERLEVFLGESVHEQFLLETRVESAIECVVEEGVHHRAASDGRVVGVGFLEVEGGQGGHPSGAVCHGGLPTEFLDGLHDTPGEEHNALIVVFGGFAYFEVGDRVMLEIVV